MDVICVTHQVTVSGWGLFQDKMQKKILLSASGPVPPDSRSCVTFYKAGQQTRPVPKDHYFISLRLGTAHLVTPYPKPGSALLPPTPASHPPHGAAPRSPQPLCAPTASLPTRPGPNAPRDPRGPRAGLGAAALTCRMAASVFSGASCAPPRWAMRAAAPRGLRTRWALCGAAGSRLQRCSRR